MPIKPLISALRGDVPDRLPIWFMRQAGRYLPEYRKTRAETGGFLDLCYTPDAALEVTLQPLRRFDLDAAILFSDILVIPQALGLDLRFDEGHGPVLSALEDIGDLGRLQADGLEERLAPVYEAMSRVAAAVEPGVAAIGFAGAPWTLASYMIEGGTSRDHARARTAAFGDLEAFDRLIDLLTACVTRHLIRQIEAGADAVQIFDSWAGALPAWGVERWSYGPAARIVTGIRAAGHETPVILFARGVGAVLALAPDQVPGVTLGLDTGTDVAWARKALGDTVCLQGNLDPMVLVAGGELLHDEATRIVRAMAGQPHVFNLGHGIVPQTPPDHVATAIEAARLAFGRDGGAP